MMCRPSTHRDARASGEARASQAWTSNQPSRSARGGGLGGLADMETTREGWGGVVDANDGGGGGRVDACAVGDGDGCYIGTFSLFRAAESIAV